MLKIYKNSVKFLERGSTKLRDEDPILVQNSLSELLKGVGNMVSSAVFTQSGDSISSKSKVKSFFFK